jgi:TorA maturation chaperone TorD
MSAPAGVLAERDTAPDAAGGHVTATDPGDVERDLEQFRAGLYALLARLLIVPPSPQLLNDLRRLDGDDTPLGQALAALARAAKRDAAAVEDEFTLLFYGMGSGGEVLPYASYYLTGNLHDRPLADLRRDMERLGIAHGGVNKEPEDHIALLLEMMHGLIVGSFDIGAADLKEQARFYDAHLSAWAKGFFGDLEAAASSDFYAALARVGSAFLAVEDDAFQMAV